MNTRWQQVQANIRSKISYFNPYRVMVRLEMWWAYLLLIRMSVSPLYISAFNGIFSFLCKDEYIFFAKLSVCVRLKLGSDTISYLFTNEKKQNARRKLGWSHSKHVKLSSCSTKIMLRFFGRKKNDIDGK